VAGLEWYPCCRLKPATRIPLVFYSSTITMMQDPINIRLIEINLNTNTFPVHKSLTLTKL